jgi:hypothetical protein
MARFYTLAMMRRYDIYPGPGPDGDGDCSPVDDVLGMDAMDREWPDHTEAWPHRTDKFDGEPVGIARELN